MTAWQDLPELDRDDYTPAYVQLGQILARHIKSHSLRPGDPLPSENELIARFGLSRTTVRQAIQLLAARQLAKKVRGKGTFVAEPRRRSVLQGGWSIELGQAKLGIMVTNRVLEMVQTEPPPWAGELPGQGQPPGWLIQRVKLAEGRAFALESRYVPDAALPLLAPEGLVSTAFREMLDQDPRFRMRRFSYNITAGLASAPEAAALVVAVGSPVLIRSSYYYNPADQAYMAGRLVLPAERAEIRYEFYNEDDQWVILTGSEGGGVVLDDRAQGR
jgi:GntR family transcriptional regulator